MTLLDHWLKFSDRCWKRIPAVAQGLLIIWVLIGILVAVIPELQLMPDLARIVIGLPASLALVWMAVSLFLSIADKVISLSRRIGGAR